MAKGSMLKRATVVALALMLTASTALADYYTENGYKVKWNGTQDTVDVTNDMGQTRTVPAFPDRNGRLVPQIEDNGADSAADMNRLYERQTSAMPSQDAGEDVAADTGWKKAGWANGNTTVPVFEDGKFKGYANVYTDANGGGHAVMPDGTVVRTAGETDGGTVDWTHASNGLTQRINITSPTTGTAPTTGGSVMPAPGTTPTTVTPGTCCEAPGPPPEPPCDPDPDYRYAILETYPVDDVYAPTLIRVVGKVRGSLTKGDPVVTTSWGQTYTMNDLGNRYWGAEILIPRELAQDGKASITFKAYLRQSDGCGDSYTGYESSTKAFNVRAVQAPADTDEPTDTYPEDQGIPGTIMTLDQYLQSCMNAFAPGWCALNDRAAMSLNEELSRTADQYMTVVGTDKYVELVRRIVRILTNNGMSSAASGVSLPEGYTLDQLLKMKPLSLN